MEIATDSGVTTAFNNMLNTLAYDAGRIAGSFASVGLTIADNLLGGFSKFLEQNKERIKEYLISMFDITSEISTIRANFAVAMADVFTVFRSDTAKQITADIISIFSNAFMGITELSGKLFRDVLDTILTPFTENKDKIKEALENTLKPIEEILGTLSDSVKKTFEELNQMYDEHIKPLFESLRDGFSEILGTLLDGYNTHIAPVLDSLSQKFTEVWEGTVQPLIENIIELIGDLVDHIKLVWEGWTKPLLNWCASVLGPIIGALLEDLGTSIMLAVDIIGQAINTVIDVLRDIISFLSAVFKGDWEGAWKSIVKIFKDIFGGVSGIAETIMGGIFDKFETFKERALGALRAVLDKINEVLFGYDDLEKAGKVKSAKGSFVSNVTSVIPRSSEVHLPRLASGTVIPPRAGEFAAILGDNKRETEVVSPISTMKQALKEALGDFGGIGGGDIHLTVNLEGKAIYDTVVKRNRMEKNRTGSNPLLA